MKNQHRRERLWNKDPRCFWCGVVTKPTNKHGGKQENDMATLDHVYSRLDPKRKQNLNLEVKTVLSCYLCNQKRGKEAMIRYKKQKELNIYA